jgi:RNA polymerase sigma-70 factor (ECF subfamily)
MHAVRQSVERSTMRLESVIADRRAPTPSSVFLQRERAVMLADELAAMPDDYREVLVLRNLEGLPFVEVAERMGRSAGAVRMLWLRAVEKLRQNLEANELI